MEFRNNVRIWGIEGMGENTIQQAETTARCPILAGPVALMPDAHLGIGATVSEVGEVVRLEPRFGVVKRRSFLPFVPTYAAERVKFLFSCCSNETE